MNNDKIRELISVAEKVAGDLTNLFEDRLREIVSKEGVALARWVGDEKPLRDECLVALARVTNEAWELFWRLSEMVNS